MVSIALYRGNLHRPSSVPRRWPHPPPSLTPAQFRRLLRSRSIALYRLKSSSQSADGAGKHDDSENGGSSGKCGESELDGEKENQRADAAPRAETAAVVDAGGDSAAGADASGGDAVLNGDVKLEPVDVKGNDVVAAEEDVVMGEAGTNLEKEPNGVSCHAGGSESAEIGGRGNSDGEDALKKNPEANNNMEVVSANEERKKELEKKIAALKEKKHNLVQMLKQILSAEEEIKMRQMQSSLLRAQMPVQSETSADANTGSKRKMTVEVNFGTELPGDSDAGSNQCTPGRPLHHVHSISPSSATFSRSPFGSHHHSVQTTRSPVSFKPGQTTPSSMVGGSLVSPSHSAAPGYQGYPHHASIPPLPVPSAGFAASSPSPVASRGPSLAFTDTRPPNFS